MGGTSKIVDRLELMGLVLHEPAIGDRGASRIAIVSAGEQLLTAASWTYETAREARLDGILNADERHQFDQLVKRLLGK